MKLVIDTNVLVSAFLWKGVPNQLIELARDRACQFFTCRLLLEELRDVLQRPKLAKFVQATGLTAEQMVVNYQKLVTLKTAHQLATQVSRDIDDDAVLACALAAKADLIVSGDEDLLVLQVFQGIRIVSAAQAIEMVIKIR
ncbi:MAG: putative toxin-antitoxin system toxin component, PIN family [Gallionella sp.]